MTRRDAITRAFYKAAALTKYGRGVEGTTPAPLTVKQLAILMFAGGVYPKTFTRRELPFPQASWESATDRKSVDSMVKKGILEVSVKHSNVADNFKGNAWRLTEEGLELYNDLIT